MTHEPVRVVIAGSRTSNFPLDAFRDRITLTIAHTEEELRQAVRTAEVLYSWRIPDTIPADTPNLRWIQLPSAGVDHVRDLPVWRSDILITAAQGMHTVPMSEHLFAMILALTRRITSMVRAQDARAWRHDGPEALHPIELRGRTIGIIGWGRIGNGVAHIARAFGMRAIGTRWSIMVPREVASDGHPFVDPPWVESNDVLPSIIYPAAQLHEVLAQSDIVALFLPLTEVTRHSIGAPEFASMKRGTLLFNMGRGQVVDQEALVQALRSGRIGGAGLDVFEREPLPRSSPLWAMDNVIISPHVGGMGDRTAERGIRLFAVNLTHYLDNQPLLNVVDREHGY